MDKENISICPMWQPVKPGKVYVQFSRKNLVESSKERTNHVATYDGPVYCRCSGSYPFAPKTGRFGIEGSIAQGKEGRKSRPAIFVQEAFQSPSHP
jgi:hypothetical protein